jgi:hypothetical protein
LNRNFKVAAVKFAASRGHFLRFGEASLTALVNSQAVMQNA